jgi:hypothetical protein
MPTQLLVFKTKLQQVLTQKPSITKRCYHQSIQIKIKAGLTQNHQLPRDTVTKTYNNKAQMINS